MEAGVIPTDRAAIPYAALRRPLFCQIAGLLPVFVTSTLAPQLREDLGIDASELGLAVALYFASCAISSPPFGRLGDRWGATRSMRFACAVSAVSLVWLSLFARSFTTLAIALTVAGSATALIEPAANVYLLGAIDPRRLGLALGIKQAAVPACTLLAGLAVPLIAEPLGWRWVYAGAAIVSICAACFPPVGAPILRPMIRSRDGDARVGALVALGCAAGLASVSGSTIAIFTVDAATHVGLTPTSAALLAAFGGVSAVATRVLLGLRADRRNSNQLGTLAVMVLAGGGMMLLLALDHRWVFILTTPLAFITGWGWSGLLNFAILRENPHSPGRATGIVLTFGFFGTLIGPLLFGRVAETSSYPTAWLCVSAASVTAFVVVLVAQRMLAASTTGTLTQAGA